MVDKEMSANHVHSQVAVIERFTTVAAVPIPTRASFVLVMCNLKGFDIGVRQMNFLFWCRTSHVTLLRPHVLMPMLVQSPLHASMCATSQLLERHFFQKIMKEFDQIHKDE